MCQELQLLLLGFRLELGKSLSTSGSWNLRLCLVWVLSETRIYQTWSNTPRKQGWSRVSMENKTNTMVHIKGPNCIQFSQSMTIWQELHCRKKEEKRHGSNKKKILKWKMRVFSWRRYLLEWSVLFRRIDAESGRTLHQLDNRCLKWSVFWKVDAKSSLKALEY